MGQISIPAINKSGYSMFWNSMWDSKHNYNFFLNQDIFIKNSLILFFDDISSNKLFFFLKFKVKFNFNKYIFMNIKNLNFNQYYNIIKNSKIELYFSKIWILKYQSWVILNLFIYFFKKPDVNRFSKIKFNNFYFMKEYYFKLFNYKFNKKFYF